MTRVLHATRREDVTNLRSATFKNWQTATWNHVVVADADDDRVSSQNSSNAAILPALSRRSPDTGQAEFLRDGGQMPLTRTVRDALCFSRDRLPNPMSARGVNRKPQTSRHAFPSGTSPALRRPTPASSHETIRCPRPLRHSLSRTHSERFGPTTPPFRVGRSYEVYGSGLTVPTGMGHWFSKVACDTRTTCGYTQRQTNRGHCLCRLELPDTQRQGRRARPRREGEADIRQNFASCQKSAGAGRTGTAVRCRASALPWMAPGLGEVREPPSDHGNGLRTWISCCLLGDKRAVPTSSRIWTHFAPRPARATACRTPDSPGEHAPATNESTIARRGREDGRYGPCRRPSPLGPGIAFGMGTRSGRG